MTVADALAVPPDPVQARLKVLVLVSAPVDPLPEVALTPDQGPEAVQEVASADDQVSVDDPPLVTDGGVAASDTVGTGGGGRVPDTVVKLEVKCSASPLPAASFASGEMVIVNCVLAARGADGVNVAVLPLTLTVPVTAARSVVVTSVKLAVVSEELVIGSEKVTATGLLSATPVAPSTGEDADTVGGVVSRTAAVVKVEVKLAASALPAASFAAVEIVALYCVPAARAAEGVNVAVLPLTFTMPATAARAVVVTSVKLAVVSVELVIGSEKVTDTEEFSATPVAPYPGEVADTVVGVVSGAAAVVNVHVKLAPRALPAASCAPEVMVAVYWVLAFSAADGVNVAVLPLMFTPPLIAAPPEVATRVKLAVVSVELVIGSENVADTEEFSAKPVAALAGDVADTVGGVVSGAAPVVKVQLKLAPSALPPESVAPVVIVAMYGVLAARGKEGVKVAELLLTLTVPGIGTPACVVSAKVLVFSVEFVIASEKVTAMAEFTAMLVAAFAGDVEETVGGVVSVARVVATATFDWPEKFADKSKAWIT